MRLLGGIPPPPPPLPILLPQDLSDLILLLPADCWRQLGEEYSFWSQKPWT